MTKLVYLDTETTGLDPDLHDVWEIAVITEDGREYAWQIKPDLTHADPRALEVGGYYTRHFSVTEAHPCPPGTSVITQHWTTEEIGDVETAETVAQQVAEFLASSVVVGSNPAFDQAFLTRWLRKHGQVWAAHYRTVDVITMGAGALHERSVLPAEPGDPHDVPYSSTGISRAFGVDPDNHDRHTALGDARWARDLYQAIAKGT